MVKKTGKREPFDREKLLRSMRIALRKRPVEAERVERVVNSHRAPARKLRRDRNPVHASARWRCRRCCGLDQIAYIRYASVYRNFREASDFNEFLDEIGGDRDND